MFYLVLIDLFNFEWLKTTISQAFRFSIQILPHQKIVGGELGHFSNLDTLDLSFCLTPASKTGGLVPSLSG